MAREYQVGYRKPPKATRFKPGQSGNPKGRPKGSPNLASDLSAELGEQITVREGGEAQRVSKQRALIKSLMAKALQGDCAGHHRLARPLCARHFRAARRRWWIGRRA